MTTNRDKETIDAVQWAKKELAKTTFGELLRSLRETDEITQVELAKKLFVSKQFLSDIERDRRSASVAFAKKVATTMGYPIEPMLEILIRDDLRKNHLDFDVKIRHSKAA
jgi:transcriptional regulator with XRE-family HTH domain